MRSAAAIRCPRHSSTAPAIPLAVDARTTAGGGTRSGARASTTGCASGRKTCSHSTSLPRRALRERASAPGGFGERTVVPHGRAVRPRCGVLSRLGSAATEAPCVLAARAPIAPVRRTTFRQTLLDKPPPLDKLRPLHRLSRLDALAC